MHRKIELQIATLCAKGVLNIRNHLTYVKGWLVQPGVLYVEVVL